MLEQIGVNRMKKLLVTAAVIMFASQVSAGIEHWTYKSKVDAFTDEIISYASYQTGEYGEAIHVRCKKSDFDLYIGFGEYIDNDGNIRAIYRVDKEPKVDNYGWTPSTKGTSIFASNKIKIKLATSLINGKNSAVFRVYDFRGTAHEISINLKGSTKAISKVMDDCNEKPQGMILSKDTISKTYSCYDGARNKSMSFRVDRRSNNSLVGVNVAGERAEHYFVASKVKDNGEELTMKKGFAKIWLNYSNNTAGQKAPLGKGDYICD